ncbi:IclR family transcriptional regulator [Mariprofundus ferrooxydans]|uniref:Transcriptional regulator, IclR family protein n=1 Tax=Mariprofundus ferrooxydans PV-1 TaxID=314345 RepID=Q0EYX3_9PROT|nr:IclR family transcriptional regulator [Mariprofundus ferrooxydans]EAU54434.1 transcriptional regulator, IclR family protein [Mariprofundus ferrooxydans PV-1]KON48362.1 IclR family transcriptional regulator [Mariprofundus ferrooxydans]
MRNESNIQVIDRMVALLQGLAQHGHAGLKVLAVDAGLHSSTAHRILASLQQHGWVARDADGGYRLGSGLLRYASHAAREIDLRQLALPVMTALRDLTGETVNLTLRESDEVVYVERVISNRLMRVEQVIGSRAPLHVTAVGKLMLGEGVPEGCMDYARRTGLPAYTANTITNARQLCDVVRLVAGQGYAFDDEEAELGVGCIGVLVRDAGGNAVAGLSISAPRERRRDEWIEPLLASGREISMKLGYQGADTSPSV